LNFSKNRTFEVYIQNIMLTQATVVISTKNRKSELYNAIISCYKQTVDLEVVVIDDGSIDGTSEMVYKEFPEAVLYRSQESKGLIFQRNFGARLSKGRILFSIDDDAVFQSPYTVEQTLQEFTDPQIGAIAIPYIDVLKDARIQQISPDINSIYVTSSFRGTAYAVRRELFLNLSGYREFYFHQGEEEDFCIRLLNQKYFVKLGLADPIHHFESPNRDTYRMDVYGPRNLVLFSWYNVPMPYLYFHLIVTSTKAILYGIKIGHPWRKILGVLYGYKSYFSPGFKREPVHKSTYNCFRYLKKQQLVTLDEAKKLLSP